MRRMTMIGGLLLLCACNGGPTSSDRPLARPAPLMPAAEPVSQQVRNLPLGERLSREADLHARARGRVEGWLNRFHQQGVALVRTKQVLAAPLSGEYCATAIAASGLAMSLCEFSDVAAAEHGMAQSRAMFDRVLPGRTLLLQQTTLLTLSHTAIDAASMDAARVRDMFAQALPGERASL